MVNYEIFVFYILHILARKTPKGAFNHANWDIFLEKWESIQSNFDWVAMKYHTILNFEHNRFLGMIQLGRYGELTSLRLRTYIHLTFLQNEKLCDITFLCGDKEIHAHRAVLCANSEYFQCMFNNGMMETSARHVPIKGKTFSFNKTQGNILISCICKMQLLVFLKRKEIFCFLGYYRYDFFGAVLTQRGILISCTWKVQLLYKNLLFVNGNMSLCHIFFICEKFYTTYGLFQLHLEHE